jgi:two-component system response regulator AtoC
MAGKVLIVDDRLESLWESADYLKERGYSVSTCGESRKALEVFLKEKPDAVLLDVKMPGKNGFDLLKEIRTTNRRVCIIMLSAYGDAETVVKAVKLGADNFAEKGSDAEKLVITLEKELEKKRMQLELVTLKAEKAGEAGGIDRIIGQSEAIRQVKKSIRDYADVDEPVLVTGENGVGKDLVATALHYESKRHEKPFSRLFLPAVPPGLFESEIFGHERGSFTDASRRQTGIIQAAGKGTVFLDEIGDLPADVQTKLLLVLDTGVYMRIGGEGKTMKTEARFVSATNVNVMNAVRTRKMREDLFFRLNKVWIEVAPLRERPDDIPLLAEYFIKIRSDEMGRAPVELSDESMDLLLRYDWPGNVRQLKSIMERVVIEGDEDLIRRDAVLSRGTPCDDDLGSDSSRLKHTVKRETAKVETRLIANALTRFKGNRTKAAGWLGISYRSLLSKMKEYRLRQAY